MFFKKQKTTFDTLESLIEGCKAQNEIAQKLLYKQFFAYAKSISLRYAANSEEASDILNESFLKIFRKIELYEAGQSFKMWLRTIVINTSIDHFRRNKKYSHVLDIDVANEIPFTDNIIDTLSAEEILDMVQQLAPAYRTVFMLYVVDGFNHREIGELLTISEGTSKSHLAKAREKLQILIQKNSPSLYTIYKNTAKTYSKN